MTTQGNAEGTAKNAPAASKPGTQPTVFTQDQVNRMVANARAEGGKKAAERVKTTLLDQFKDEPDKLDALKLKLQAEDKAAQADAVLEELETLRERDKLYQAQQKAVERKDKAAEIAKAENVDPVTLQQFADLDDERLPALARTLPKLGEQPVTFRPDSGGKGGGGNPKLSDLLKVNTKGFSMKQLLEHKTAIEAAMKLV
jgi:hypothetical protein